VWDPASRLLRLRYKSPEALTIRFVATRVKELGGLIGKGVYALLVDGVLAVIGVIAAINGAHQSALIIGCLCLAGIAAVALHIAYQALKQRDQALGSTNSGVVQQQAAGGGNQIVVEPGASLSYIDARQVPNGAIAGTASVSGASSYRQRRLGADTDVGTTNAGFEEVNGLFGADDSDVPEDAVLKLNVSQAHDPDQFSAFRHL